MHPSAARPVDEVTRQYQALLDHLEQAVIATDHGGIILRWSATAERLYGWSASEVVGRSIVEVTPSNDSRDRAGEIMSALTKGELWSGTFAVRSRDGRTFNAAVTDLPILDEGDKVAEIIGISAPAKPDTDLAATARDFHRAASTVWPERIALQIDPSFRAVTSVSEPHLLHLFSLLLIRHADSLNQGMVAEIAVGPAEQSAIADFLIPQSERLAYVGIGIRNPGHPSSIIRSVRRGTEPTDFARTLVRLLGGRLFAGSAGRLAEGMHFLMPVDG